VVKRPWCLGGGFFFEPQSDQLKANSATLASQDQKTAAMMHD
jgi:hypothetical protein